MPKITRAGARRAHKAEVKKKVKKKVKPDLSHAGTLKKGSTESERSLAKEFAKLGEFWEGGEKLLDPGMQDLIKAERQRKRKTFTLKKKN